MAKFERFEDMEVWKLARDLCKSVHKLTRREPFKSDYRFKAQIESSSGSIMDNIAEGFERGGNKEFRKFLRYSKGSSGEVRSQIIRAFDKDYISREECKEVYELTNVIGRKLKNLIEYLKRTKRKGTNY